MNEKNRKIVVAVTGASGFCYAVDLLRKLSETAVCQENIVVVFSENGKKVAEYEAGKATVDEIAGKYRIFDDSDFTAPFASGSSSFDTLIVVPCSMGTLARIASGVSSGLIARTADVMLKERRRLILAIRETPLSLIHIENMLKVTQTGGIICPASPSFYSNPRDFNSLISTVTERILSLAEINYPNKYSWNYEL